MKNNFFAVMVICNRSLENSQSFNSLKKISGIGITVCDNSTEENDNRKYEGENVRYINMGGNLGLSKAYNTAVQSLEGKEGYICLFDDDTLVPGDYFEKIDLEAEKSGADIILPVVRDEVGIMSPCRLTGVLTSRVKDISELNEAELSGINSGMAVNNEIFKSYRYDEEYFLDFIDHAFLRDMKKQGRKISVCDDISLNQSFSANDKNIERAKRRFKLFKRDYAYFCKQSGKLSDVITGKLYLLKRSININILYRLGR